MSFARGRDWRAGLPPELLQNIATKLTEISDYARFRAVCVPWRSAASPSDLSPQPPWMIVIDGVVGAPHFLTIAGIEALHLPECQRDFIIGSSNGWLLTLDSRLVSPAILNPITRTRIRPPTPPSSISHERMCAPLSRMVFTSTSDWTVMSQFTSGLFFCRSGDESWTEIGCTAQILEYASYKGRFFILAIDDSFKTIVFDGVALAQVSAIPMAWNPGRYRHYLVESSSGELLLVVCTWRWQRDLFEIYQFNESEEPQWLRVRSIGDNILFVDWLHALSAAASGLNGFRRNCIYFMQNHRKVWIFDIGNAKLEAFRDYPTEESKSQGVWMIPSLC